MTASTALLGDGHRDLVDRLEQLHACLGRGLAQRQRRGALKAMSEESTEWALPS